MIIIINADNDNDIIPTMLREELWLPGGPGLGPGGHGGFGHGLGGIGPGGHGEFEIGRLGEEPKSTSGISIFWQFLSVLDQSQSCKSWLLWFIILLLSFINIVQAFWILLYALPNESALFDIFSFGVGIL